MCEGGCVRVCVREGGACACVWRGLHVIKLMH